jgi:acetolactate synthase-1/2/3 large subunit
MPAPRTAARVLVDQLLVHGADRVYCVPGESYLDVLDAIYDDERAGRLKLISCRQEGGAAFMAEAHGKLTGQPGICFVTRGPGACNASIGVHTAFHDCTPMILFIGQVARPFLEREGFQEMDFRRMFASFAKWSMQLDDARRIPELVARAWQVAISGRPGPVVISLPEDVLEDVVTVHDALPCKRQQPGPTEAQMRQLHTLLAGAKQPLVVVGGGDWSAQAADDLRAFAHANALPVAAAFRAQDVMDNRAPEYIGNLGINANPALTRRVEQADVILAIGDRLSEVTTNDYKLLAAPRLAQTLVHVFPSADELGRVYQPALAITSGMAEFACMARKLPPLANPVWAAETRQARAEYERFSTPVATGDVMDLGAIYQHLRATLPQDAIICNGAGNYTTFVHRNLQWSHYRSQLAPVNGTMGYGVPAAVAAKLMHPGRAVIAFAGDGCFLMNGQELATAVQYGANIIVIVINNGRYGTIRTHQDRRFPGRVAGTNLRNPDFVAYARAFGAHGELVTRTADFAPALVRAQAAGTPALIELQVI